MVSFAQTPKQSIEKVFKDPKTAENAAKADVYILKNKHVIIDTSTVACKPKISRRKALRRK